MPSETAVEAKPQAVKLEPGKTINLPSAVLGLAVASDGKLLYAACLDRFVYQVDVESKQSKPLFQHRNYASGVKLLANGTQLVSAGYDGALQWFDLAAGKVIRQVDAHRFWSWKLAVSPDQKLVASVTGQYLAGSIDYVPADSPEPTVKVFDALTGEVRHAWTLRPPVLSVAFSPDSQHVAAGNLLGEVGVWNLGTGEQVAAWKTEVFTSWGYIKSHHYVGGIYGMAFSANGEELLLAGMGDMKDPMAGNGAQTWQRFAWREQPARKVDQIHAGEHGNGLMETLTVHPSGEMFVMAGRLAQGNWNAALFQAGDGKLIHSIDNKQRNIEAVFSADGRQLFLAGAVGQRGRDKEGQCPDFGRIQVMTVAS